MGNLDQLMKDINKSMGADIVHMGMGSFDYERIPFTSPRLNYITFGGLPVGKLIEFYGEEHGGKTTTALDIVANYQNMNRVKAESDSNYTSKTVIYADLENTLDTVWATKLGVSVDDMLIINPTNQGAETIFEWLLKMIDTGEVGLVIIDSLGVMVSNQALEKTVEEKTYGGISQALTNFSKKAEMLCHKHSCTMIGINQVRADMNSMYGGTTTTGGMAWKHNCSCRMEFRRGKFFDDKYKDLSRSAENPIGNYVNVAMVKNKTCPPTRHTGFYTLRYDIGIDYLYDLVEVAQKYGLIEKRGSWFGVTDPETGEVLASNLQGQSKLYEFLENPENRKTLEWLEDKVTEYMSKD